MEWVEIACLMLGMVIGLMALGLPVAFAFLIADLVGRSDMPAEMEGDATAGLTVRPEPAGGWLWPARLRRCHAARCADSSSSWSAW